MLVEAGEIPGIDHGGGGVVVDGPDVTEMFDQALLALLVVGVALLDLLQAVAHQELVVPRGEDCGRHVDQHRDPGVAVVHAEDAAAEERRAGQPRTQVTGQIGGDGVCGKSCKKGGRKEGRLVSVKKKQRELGCWGGKAINQGGRAFSLTPDHAGICQTNGEWNRLRRHEGVGRIQTGPDDDTDVTVHKKFLEEEEPLVGLVGVRDYTGDRGHPTVEEGGAVLFNLHRSGSLFDAKYRSVSKTISRCGEAGNGIL